MPVRNGSSPVFDVSMWPLNIRLRPSPAPSQRPITLARPSSTSRHVTLRRLVRASANAVADRVRWLPWIPAFGDARANELVQLRQRRAGTRKRNRLVEDAEQQVRKLVVLRREFAGTNVLGEVRPIAVGAD